MRHFRMPDPDGDGRQPASDLPDPVVNAQRGEGLGDGFVKGLRRHAERVLCFVQVVDDDGAALECHEGKFIIFAICSPREPGANGPE